MRLEDPASNAWSRMLTNIGVMMEISVLSMITCRFKATQTNARHVGMIERQYPRFVVQLPLVFSGDRFGWGTLLNLSYGGCLVESQAQVKGGDSLTLRILLSHDTPSLRVEMATVAWAEMRRFGLFFGRMVPSERERFDDYLQTLRIPISKRVLIVMSSSDVATALKQRLQPWGCMVKTVSDGVVGLQEVNRFKPHLIILDVEIPAGGGISLIERLKSSTLSCEIPILVLTGCTDTSILERVLELGVANYLYTPVALDACIADAKRLLGIDKL